MERIVKSVGLVLARESIATVMSVSFQGGVWAVPTKTEEGSVNPIGEYNNVPPMRLAFCCLLPTPIGWTKPGCDMQPNPNNNTMS
ncbi:hypothetical protein JB92DRAFT_2946160 [Gautieria morchelliformis]|nr:hypothetical protein JB92DRAFT_2946160 [Gautieria morchelliformis]